MFPRQFRAILKFLPQIASLTVKRLLQENMTGKEQEGDNSL